MTAFSTLVILACPVCTYNRFYPTWLLFAALRLLIVVAVSYRRLDLVRTLGAFVVFEVGYYYAWRAAIWYSHPAVAEGFIAWTAVACLIVLSAGTPAFILLMCLSRSRYFRTGHPVLLTWRYGSLLLPALFTLAYIQGRVANEYPTH